MTVEEPRKLRVTDLQDLIARLSAAAIARKEDGDWQTCDLLREARNAIEKLAKL